MFKRLFIHSPYKYLVCLGIMLIIPVIYNLLRNEWDLIINYMDSFFLAGLVLILVGMLSIVDYFGGLDIFRYIFIKRNPDGSKKTLYDFSEGRKEKIKDDKYRFTPYMVVGVISILISVIIRLSANI